MGSPFGVIKKFWNYIMMTAARHCECTKKPLNCITWLKWQILGHVNFAII